MSFRVVGEPDADREAHPVGQLDPVVVDDAHGSDRGDRLGGLGLTRAHPGRTVICYRYAEASFGN